MSPLASKILIVGVPLLASLGWFAFWMVRLTRAARRPKGAGTRPGGKVSEPPDRPAG